jgi:AAA domain (dynein-related subfamily)
MSNAVNLQEIDQEQALHLSKFFIRSQQNLFIFGRRGVGKTHIALQAAKDCNFKVNYINLSVIERPDLAGYPNMNDPGETITFKSPSFLPKLLGSNKPNSIILFDEVDKAPPEVTAPLLEILQFRSINGVPINVAGCILTGNLANEGAYSNQISSALLDRGAKYILSFNFEKWIDWAKSNEINDLILAFLRSNPELACGKLEDSCYASPSPRGWTLASEALTRARELKIVDIDTVAQIISGFVGGEAGLRFKIWYEHFRKFEPFIFSLIESGTMNFDFNTLTPAEKAMFVVSACYLAKQKVFLQPIKSKQRFVYLENLCHFFLKYHVDHELQVMGLYNSFSFDKIALHKLYGCKIFFDLFTKLSEGVVIKK